MVFLTHQGSLRCGLRDISAIVNGSRSTPSANKRLCFTCKSRMTCKKKKRKRGRIGQRQSVKRKDKRGASRGPSRGGRKDQEREKGEESWGGGFIAYTGGDIRHMGLFGQGMGCFCADIGPGGRSLRGRPMAWRSGRVLSIIRVLGSIEDQLLRGTQAQIRAILEGGGLQAGPYLLFRSETLSLAGCISRYEPPVHTWSVTGQYKYERSHNARGK